MDNFTKTALSVLMGKLLERNPNISLWMDSELNNLPTHLQESVWKSVKMYPSNIPIEEVLKVENEDSAPRYQKRTAADALGPIAPVDWVVERLFSRASLSVVVAAPGSKKTYSMLSAGVCVALGKPWLDFETHPCRVLMVDEESGENRLSRRLGEVLRGEYGDDVTPIDFISLAQFNLREEADVELLRSEILSGGYGFVVIDALVDVMPGGDENSAKDVQPIFLNLRKIAAETQSAIVVIHHTNKKGGYRGSSAISGAVDLLLRIDSKKGSPNVDFDTEKARDVEPFRFSGACHWENGKFWMTSTKTMPRVEALSPSQVFVLSVFEEKGPVKMSVIQQEAPGAGITPDAARSAVYSLAKMGLAQRVNQGGQGVAAIYGPVNKRC